jgi:hypothetical protein
MFQGHPEKFLPVSCTTQFSCVTGRAIPDRKFGDDDFLLKQRLRVTEVVFVSSYILAVCTFRDEPRKYDNYY